MRDKNKKYVTVGVALGVALSAWLVYSLFFTSVKMHHDLDGPGGSDMKTEIVVTGTAYGPNGKVVDSRELTIYRLMALKWVYEGAGPSGTAISSYQISAGATFTASGWDPAITSATWGVSTQYATYTGTWSSWANWDGASSVTNPGGIEGNTGGTFTDSWTGGSKNLETMFQDKAGAPSQDGDKMHLRIGGWVSAENGWGSDRDPTSGYRYKTGSGEASGILVTFEREYYGSGGDVNMAWTPDIWETLKSKTARCVQDFTEFASFKWLYDMEVW